MYLKCFRCLSSLSTQGYQAPGNQPPETASWRGCLSYQSHRHVPVHDPEIYRQLTASKRKQPELTLAERKFSKNILFDLQNHKKLSRSLSRTQGEPY